MTEVPVLDSMAIGEIVRAFNRVNDAGGSLKLVGLTDRVYGALKITQLLGLIESFKTEEDALESFKQEKRVKPKSKGARAKKTVKTGEDE